MKVQTTAFAIVMALLSACSASSVDEGPTETPESSATAPREITPGNPPTAVRPTQTSETTRSALGGTQSKDSPQRSSHEGYVRVTTDVGDAGNYFIYAGKVIEVAWVDPPLSCEHYEFAYSDASGNRVLLGADPDPSDGVSLEWEVPEQVRAEGLRGEAQCEGIVVSSWETGFVSSGDLPPDGVCVVASSNIEALYVSNEPSDSAQVFGVLASGDYARALERTQDGWYRIETTAVELYFDAVELYLDVSNIPASGWITERNGIELFGPCEGVPTSRHP